MKTPRRKPTTKHQLAIVRAQLRAYRESLGRLVNADFDLKASATSIPYDGPPKFIQCWAVSGRPVTQALDSEGQVWERIWRKATDTMPEESWWEPLSMERRKKKAAP